MVAMTKATDKNVRIDSSSNIGISFPACKDSIVAELKEAIHDYLDRHNAEPTPFVWTKTAKVILEKEARALAALRAAETGNQALESEH